MRRAVLLVLFILVGQTASAQWVRYPTPGSPRMPDGRPDLTARTPRASNGKPDLSGVWHVQPTSLEEMKRLFGNDVDTIQVPGMETDTVSKYAINIFQDFKPEDAPVRPEVAEVLKRRGDGRPEALPLTYCLPGGVPLSTMLSEVSKIVQTPGLTLIMLELGGTRQIYTDGRKHMADPSPSWLGYSVGKWEGDSLVVDTLGFNGKSWLDIIGHPQSESARVVERYRRRDFGHMDVEITIDDPKWYTKPFTVKVTHLLQPDTDILEYFCNENEQDRRRMGLE
ncbi:MAG TPA: hypothetical protein VI485_08625 [Vicinamibacterales bacterium]|nr:hypothetical protein [Vicinamibacterales bacterium]